MTPFAALALYPLWALAVATGLVALRFGRARRSGLVLLSLGLAVWVTGLILLESGSPWAERVLPIGMLLAGAVVQAGLEVAGERAPRLLAIAYAYGIAVSLLGALAPRLLYGEGAHGPGPMFFPLTLASTAGTIGAIGFLTHLARRASGAERRRRTAVALASVFGALGGGGVIAMRVLALGDVQVAAPLLFVSTLLTAYAVLSGEDVRARNLIVQGAVQAVITAVLSAVGLTLFYLWLPRLTPAGGSGFAWLVFVVFFAALPLEPLRMLVVERVGRALFRNPIAVPDLAEAVDQSEARADHAERLAEMGRVVSAVAHEMRNPLGVIAAQTKILERRGVEADALAPLRAQVDRARRFLDDLLRYGKPRPLELRDFDAGAAIELAVGNARQAFGADAPAAEVQAASAGRIEADRNAFTDVVTVLVNNACIAASGVANGGATAPVRVSARDDAGALLLVVEDDGPGVPRELEEKLFQPFVTGRGRDARHPGTGLGLAIAARWLERHGGSLRYERAPSGGARFVARWPRRA